MKKIIFLMIGLMMVTSVAFAQRITPEDLGGLKGTWAGNAFFKYNVICPIEVVILNDTVPVKARITLSIVPEEIKSALGGTDFSNDDGQITTQGSLMFAANRNFLELFYRRNKLDGWFYKDGMMGELVLFKR